MCNFLTAAFLWEDMMYYLFDMDGVLFCSAPVTIRAATEVLKTYGVTAQKEDFIPFFGAGEARFIGGVAEKYGVAYEPAMKDKTYEKYLQYVKEGLVVYPGVKTVLETLKAEGHGLALCSSADRIKIEANMETAHIPLSLFDVIVSGSDVTRKKPSPDIFLSAAQKLLTNPKDCIVIEDALTGIQAAKNVGMACVAVTNSFSREQLADEQPDFIIDSLSELLHLNL